MSGRSSVRARYKTLETIASMSNTRIATLTAQAT
jgi:hypothetical protein